jgi:small subunit ribosomal protein S18
LGKRGNRPTVEKSTSRGSSSMSSRQSGPKGSQGTTGSSGSAALNLRQRKRYCYFCKEDVNYIDYKNVAVLKKFVSDKGKIRPKRSTGNCVQHQKMIADAIKRSREVALMAYFRR